MISPQQKSTIYRIGLTDTALWYFEDWKTRFQSESKVHSDFSNYLTAWCLNQESQLLDPIDDAETMSQLRKMQSTSYAAHIFSFVSLTALYALNKGFSSDLSIPLRYLRHAFVLGSGTYFLPKYLITSSFNASFTYLTEQQHKYHHLYADEKTIEQTRNRVLNVTNSLVAQFQQKQIQDKQEKEENQQAKEKSGSQ